MTFTRSPRRPGILRCAVLYRLPPPPPNIHSALSSHLPRERDDLHEAPLSQLAADGAEDAGRPRLPRIVDDDRGIVVEADVGSILPPNLLRGANDDGLGHVTLLHRTIRQRILDRDDD